MAHVINLTSCVYAEVQPAALWIVQTRHSSFAFRKTYTGSITALDYYVFYALKDEKIMFILQRSCAEKLQLFQLLRRKYKRYKVALNDSCKKFLSRHETINNRKEFWPNLWISAVLALTSGSENGNSDKVARMC